MHDEQAECQQGDSSHSLLTSGERLYSPAALAKAIKVPGHRGGPSLNGSTIFRHIVKGVRTPSGELIRLDAARVGSRWLSSVEAFARFSSRLTAASISAANTPAAPTPTPRQCNAAAARASREADQIFGSVAS